MAPNTQITVINPDTERAILLYSQKAHELLMNQFSLRTNLEQTDRYYMREKDFTEAQLRARLANRIGDANHIQDVTVPIVMPQVRAALSYFINVFLTGYPIFGVSSDPANEDAALQLETVIAENAITAGWARQLIMFFIDGLKYNLHGVELEWQQKNTFSLEQTTATNLVRKPKNTTWKGNVLRRVDLYNTFFDPRVHPSEIHSEGEYAGYIDMYSRTRFKKMMNDMFGQISPDVVKRAFESGPAPGGMTGSGSPFSYYVPLINPYPIMARQNVMTFDWMAWATASMANPQSQGIKYQNVYELTKLYARIIPADFGLKVPERNTPQVWKFIIVNGQVVLYAERQSNVHNFIPMFFGQPLEDGLDYQTKSFAQNVFDMQDIASAMWNGYIASKRRLVGDRVLYDPLRVAKKDINSTNPAAKIPVRPSAFGKPVNEAVYQFPYRDEATQTLLDGATRVIAYADKINNQNPAMAGQFVKGNKTQHEYDDVMGHGNAGNQAMAMMTEMQVFTPMKEAIKLNILQYQEADNLYNRDKQKSVAIKPETLIETSLHFKVSDGLEPKELQMSEDEFQTALQVIGSNQQIAGDFQAGPLFTYFMKLRGADLTPFAADPVQQQAQQKFAQMVSILAPSVEKGVMAPDAEAMKNWQNFFMWLQGAQQKIEQQAEQEAQQQQSGQGT